MDMMKDFESEVTEKFGAEFYEVMGKFVDSALEKSKGDSGEFEGWTFSSSIEKHDALNYSYHFSAYNDEDFDDECMIDFTFYTGIDVGCELVHYSLDGGSLMSQPRYVDVLVDLKPDWSRYPDASDIKKKKIEIILEYHKKKILELYSKQNYDNYVTGGGSERTSTHYKEQFSKYEGMGLFWECVYEQEEIMPNMI